MAVTQNNHIFWKGVLFFSILSACAVLPISTVSSYSIENIPNTEVRSDFVVGPGRFELEMKPGETRTIEITVTNRMGDTRMFNFETEDFKGSDSVEDTVILLGDDRGPYSLKDFISVPEYSFELNHAERATIPVTISVPTDTEPGGLYGSLLTSTASKPTITDAPTSAVIARIGTLFFIRVPGEVEEAGQLTSFETIDGKKMYGSGPIDFRLLYKNSGSVHLNPYGEISVKNILGKEIGLLKISPWFAMPDSLRLREVSWESSFLVGKYTATASINRGYDNVVDTLEYTFWVFPVKLLVLICVSIVLVLFVLRFIITRFEIRKK